MSSTGNTVSVLLNSGSGTFAAKVDYPAGTKPSSVAAFDANGDGKIDLAVVNAGANTVSVLLNNGNGTFAAKADYTTAVNPASVVAADLNGDGKADLAVVNQGSDSVTVMLNNGGFAVWVDYPTGPGPVSLVAADLNGDGKVDLAVANQGTGIGDGTVSVLINNGNGTFAGKVDYPAGRAVKAGPLSIAAADLSDDGKPDLATAKYGNATVSVLVNNGNGTFAAGVDYGVGWGPRSLAAADLDGDGKPDLAVPNHDGASVSVLLRTCLP